MELARPMLMVRGKEGKSHVLYNRCPHRGNMMVVDRHGNCGEFFRCSYHAWTFHHDGRLKSIPMMESGYAGTRYGRDNPDSGVYRIDYTQGNRRPVAKASATPSSGQHGRSAPAGTTSTSSST